MITHMLTNCRHDTVGKVRDLERNSLYCQNKGMLFHTSYSKCIDNHGILIYVPTLLKNTLIMLSK